MVNPLVLITGATGAVGPLVVKAFLEEGHSIRTLSLDPPPFDSWPKGIDTRIGDITDSASIRSAMCGVDIVVHMAALLHIVNPPPAMKHKYERINVEGTSIVVNEAIKAGAKRIVFFSTIAVYGESYGRILTEGTPTRPNTFYTRTKLDAEKIVLEARNEEGLQIGSVLRLGAVYGARIKGNYYRLFKSLANGRFIPVGDCSNRRTLIYEKDVGRAAVLAAAHEAAAGKVFNVTDGTFHTLSEIIETICTALGKDSPRFNLPAKPMRWMAGLLEDSSRLLGMASPVTRSTIDKFTEDIAVDSGLIQKDLGFTPKYDLYTGWKEAIMEMRGAEKLIRLKAS
ncbi:MAG TPA: NAD-dependent epimerase/dehydratase family protein [Smithellaceae bacterium]|nr:NAD-dependent epimerase/dehydratase family protein [Smithellaceae bacterium]